VNSDPRPEPINTAAVKLASRRLTAREPHRTAAGEPILAPRDGSTDELDGYYLVYAKTSTPPPRHCWSSTPNAFLPHRSPPFTCLAACQTAFTAAGSRPKSARGRLLFCGTPIDGGRSRSRARTTPAMGTAPASAGTTARPATTDGHHGSASLARDLDLIHSGSGLAPAASRCRPGHASRGRRRALTAHGDLAAPPLAGPSDRTEVRGARAADAVRVSERAGSSGDGATFHRSQSPPVGPTLEMASVGPIASVVASVEGCVLQRVLRRDTSTARDRWFAAGRSSGRAWSCRPGHLSVQTMLTTGW
jgi:hypothetical protein